MKDGRKRMFCFCFATVTTALVSASLAPDKPTDLPGHFDSPVMAVYMSRGVVEVQALIPTDLRETWTRFLLADLLFLAAYGSLFFTMAAVLREKPSTVAQVAGWLGTGVSVLAPLLDLAENAAIYFGMNGSEQMAGLIRSFSLWKWGLVGASAALVSRLLATPRPLDSEEKVVRRAASFFYLAAAVIAFFGLAFDFVLERVAAPLAIAILMQTYIAWCYPHVVEPVVRSHNRSPSQGGVN